MRSAKPLIWILEPPYRGLARQIGLKAAGVGGNPQVKCVAIFDDNAGQTLGYTDSFAVETLSVDQSAGIINVRISADIQAETSGTVTSILLLNGVNGDMLHRFDLTEPITVNQGDTVPVSVYLSLKSPFLYDLTLGKPSSIKISYVSFDNPSRGAPAFPVTLVQATNYGFIVNAEVETDTEISSSKVYLLDENMNVVSVHDLSITIPAGRNNVAIQVVVDSTSYPCTAPFAWDIVLDFDTWDDAKLFKEVFWSRQSCYPANGVVSDSVFTYYGASGWRDFVWAFWEDKPPSRVEVIFKINPVTGSYQYSSEAIGVGFGDGEKVAYVYVGYPRSPQDSIYVFDEYSDNWAEIPYTSDWLRGVWDFDNGVFKLYDLSGNELASLPMTFDEQPWLITGISIGAINSSYKASISIDKILIKFRDVPPRQNASGLDPYDPTWTPQDGWDIVYEMRCGFGMSIPFNYGEGEAIINETLHFTTPPGKTYNIGSYADGISFRRVAVAFRIDIKSANLPDYVMYVDEAIPPNWISPEIVLAQGNTRALRLHDYVNDNYIDVPYDGDWVVAVFDLDNRKLTLYDKNNNVIGSLNLTTGSFDREYLDLNIAEENNFNGNTYKIYVDWIAVRINECTR